MKATIILFLIFCFSISFAQDEFAKGYIKMPKKDTMKGEIKLALKNDMDYYSKVYFRQKPNVKPKQFLPNKITGYGFDDKHFAAMKFMDQWVYMKIICNGKISVYEYKPPVSLGNEAKESIYLVMKGGADEMTQLDPQGKLKKQLKPIFSDDKEILKELDKKDLDFKMALELISRYNANNL